MAFAFGRERPAKAALPEKLASLHRNAKDRFSTVVLATMLIAAMEDAIGSFAQWQG
jgi:hypothetical protein